MKIHPIDLKFQDVPGVIAAYLVECDGELALIETGPGSTLPTLCAGIRASGFSLEAVKKVFVTHVHLDHAGAAGWWAQQGARIYCHPRARRHLVEPGKLIESARQVYGEAFDSLWGEMVAAPEAQVVALEDGESVSLGNAKVVALDTPGHARHHHVFAIGGLCFTGDVAGVRLEASGYLSVAAAPPQFELEPYRESVRRLRQHAFEMLYLTHFGRVENADDHLSRYELRLNEVAELATNSLHAGETELEWRNRYGKVEESRALEVGCSPALWERYQVANGTGMCADGLRLWAEKEKEKEKAKEMPNPDAG